MTKPNATRSVSFVERAQAALIVYPRFRELHREIQLCQRMSKLAGEPQCMSLEGRTGTGKSTLVRTYADSFHRTETKEGTRIPVLYLEVPSPVGIKDLASVALKRMGDPAYERGTRASMTMRLIGLIKDCGVELVILDDFHHLIDSETNHILTEVSEWLKYLIKETGVPFLVVGIEGKVELILQANAQLSRLFAARETLQPFRWETANPQTIQEFAHFVDYVEKAVEKPLSSEVRRTEMLYRIHYATDGVVGNVMNLIRFAAMLCEMRGKSAIGLAILSLAFQQRLAKHLSHKCDPFSESVTVRFTPSVSASSTKPGPVPRGRRRKKHEPSIAETLTTR
jgi:hypothetical protein